MSYPPLQRVNHPDAFWELAHNEWCSEVEHSHRPYRRPILRNPPLIEMTPDENHTPEKWEDTEESACRRVKEVCPPGIVTETISYAHINRQGIAVVPGQIWESCDRRDRGLRKRVVEVEGGYCYFAGVTVGEVIPGTDMIASKVRPPTRVAIRRLYPHSSGYRLVPASEGGVAL